MEVQFDGRVSQVNAQKWSSRSKIVLRIADKVSDYSWNACIVITPHLSLLTSPLSITWIYFDSVIPLCASSLLFSLCALLWVCSDTSLSTDLVHILVFLHRPFDRPNVRGNSKVKCHLSPRHRVHIVYNSSAVPRRTNGSRYFLTILE